MHVSDLERCYSQYQKHKELNHLKINYIQKIALSGIFLLLLPTVILNIFFIKKKKNNKTYVLEYTKQEPYKTIYKYFQNNQFFHLISLPKFVIPILPYILIRDILLLMRKQPLFIFKNLDFIGALALKVGTYNTLLLWHNVSTLIVMQEYSFYITYITRVLENRKGKFYNIQHGIPGETYCFFRFTKCFVWGEYYQTIYIQNHAEASQFIVSGSLFHNISKNKIIDKKQSIDILFIMQGYAGGKDEAHSILKVLNTLSTQYTIKLLQHPRHRIRVKENLSEYEGTISNAIKESKIVVSSYSTGMIDALSIKKCALAYIGKNKQLREYVEYLDEKNIFTDEESLRKRLVELLSSKALICHLDEQYINTAHNPIKVVLNEINKNTTI